MSDSDLVKLYSARILALAADIPHHGRLTSPQGTARRRSPPGLIAYLWALHAGREVHACILLYVRLLEGRQRSCILLAILDFIFAL